MILVGEIRDLETAEMAIQASLTGHLVFSTLHTNDAPSAFTRLIDMGVEPFLVASTVEGVMAQRLVRTICPDCKTSLRAGSRRTAARLPAAQAGREAGSGTRHPAGRGRDDGRRGGQRRQAVEGDGLPGVPPKRLPRPDRHPRTDGDQRRHPGLIVQRVNAGVIRLEALKAGMITLRQDGWRKVLNGTTTIDEVARTTAGDIS